MHQTPISERPQERSGAAARDTRRRTVWRAVIVLLAVMAGSGQAAAMPAEVTTNLNLRGGPGTQHPVLDVLRAGQRVEIDRCSDDGWCYVLREGANGWVFRNFLRELTIADTPDPETAAAPDAVTPMPAAVPPQVCFFAEPLFGGASFCAGPGDGSRALDPSWAGAVGSIRVEGQGTRVDVCAQPDLRNCTIVDADLATLGPASIASYRVLR